MQERQPGTKVANNLSCDVIGDVSLGDISLV